MNQITQFITEIHNATVLPSKDIPERLLRLLRLHPALNPWVVTIYNAGDFNEKQIKQQIEKKNFFNDEWMAFESVILSFIKLSEQLNPESLFESFDLYANYLNDLTTAYTNKSQGYLVGYLLKDSFEFIIPMAAQLDEQLKHMENNRRPRLSFIAALLLKVFNNIRSQLGAGDYIESAKKSIMLFVSIRLCLVYFKLSNPLLCRNVFSNMSNASIKLSHYSKNEQLQYRYYLARFYMVKNQFIDAYQHLQWCLLNCPANYIVDNANVTRILRYLIPSAIIIGRCPNLSTIARTFYSSPALCPGFLTTYSEIVSALKRGSFRDLSRVLQNEKNHVFLKQNGLLVALSQKTPVIIIRNLVRKVWRLGNQESRLDYDSLRIALEHSLAGIQLSAMTLLQPTFQLQGIPLDDYSVENCLITLIDQNLLKGKIFSRLRLVSLSKSGVFPHMDSLAFIKFGHGAEGVLNRTDKWMD